MNGSMEALRVLDEEEGRGVDVQALITQAVANRNATIESLLTNRLNELLPSFTLETLRGRLEAVVKHDTPEPGYTTTMYLLEGHPFLEVNEVPISLSTVGVAVRWRSIKWE